MEIIRRPTTPLRAAVGGRGRGGVRMRVRSTARYIAVAAIFALGAVACSSGGGGGGSTGGGGGGGGTAANTSPHKGGSIILGAEQWPQCLNPVTDCASA